MEEISMKKWYLQTWFIALMFALWPFIIPGIVGIILLILHYQERKKFLSKYGDYETLINKTNSLFSAYQDRQHNLNDDFLRKEAELQKSFSEKEALFKEKCSILDSDLAQKKTDIAVKIGELENSFAVKELMLKEENENKRKNFEETLSSLRFECQRVANELKSLEKNSLIAHYNFSDYSGITSEQCKNKLAILKQQEKDYIKSDLALEVSSDRKKKEIKDNAKQILRCFNAECDNILMNLSVKNIDSMRNKIASSFESLNKIFSVDGICMTHHLLELKLEELNLAYTFELKRDQEREQQQAIKAQMVEEEKVRREIERQKAKIEKDQLQCNNEIHKLMSYMKNTSSDAEKQLYIDKIDQLERKMNELEKDKDTVLEREANARAGFVYVISNIGSFGENIYKIGMTRRLEPMDRVRELSSASVPFQFDVHAMIFSDDAPALESILHKHFEKNSVNRINLRKEFFNVSLDEIESVVKENFNNTVEFIRVPAATEYRQTQELLRTEQSK